MGLRHILLGAAASSLVASAALADRGTDGQLNILYWQAVSIMTPYLSNGTKDIQAREPRARAARPLRREAATMVPYLAESIPTVENGGVSKDLLTITWKLKDGLLWSDGTPVTADDAVFTWQYCTDPEGGCAQLSNFSDVKSVEAVDPQTIKITFGVAKPFPYGPLVGAQSPILQKKQFADCIGEKAPTCTEANTKPIGTGPFMVTDFKANDVVLARGEPELPRSGQARLRDRGASRAAATRPAPRARCWRPASTTTPGTPRSSPRSSRRWRRPGRARSSRPSARWSSGCRSTRPTPTRRWATSARPRRTRIRS